LAELAKLHDVRANQIVHWKNRLLTRAAGSFGGRHGGPQIGGLALENDFLAGTLDKVGLSSAKR
jgi:hypothetical protein